MQNQNNQDKIPQDQADGRLDRKVATKDPAQIVRETEDASLQDKEYSFDEDNTANEEYHDVDDLDADTDLTETLDNEDDLQ